MKSLIILALISISHLSFTSTHQTQTGFRLNGTATGFIDGTILYLEWKTDDGKNYVDSTAIINDKFTFKGVIPEKSINALIRTHQYTDYKFLWLENAAITFVGTKGSFREAVISGSKAQDESNELNKSIKAAPGKEFEENLAFIEKHPNSIVSAHILSVYSTTWGKEKVQLYYDKLTEEMKKTSYGKNIADYISLNKDVKIGNQYVDFVQEDPQQKAIKLSDFKGKVVLLEFWGSWCGPCRQSHPELVKIYDEFKGKGFEILGVGAEQNKEAWLDAIKQDKLIWPNVSDLKGDKNRAALIYGVSYYPTNFLIDKSGTIIARDLKGEKLREKLKEIL